MYSHIQTHITHFFRPIVLFRVYSHRNHSRVNFLLLSFSPYLSSNGPKYETFMDWHHTTSGKPHTWPHMIGHSDNAGALKMLHTDHLWACGMHMKRLDLSPRLKIFYYVCEKYSKIKKKRIQNTADLKYFRSELFNSCMLEWMEEGTVVLWDWTVIFVLGDMARVKVSTCRIWPWKMYHPVAFP